MTRRRRHANDRRLHAVLGITAILVLAACVYISYTANSGLPWSASYEVNADVPNADRLIKTDEVRIAGVRVGQVSSVTARLSPDGHPYSVLGLSLNSNVRRLARDTEVEVQSSSVLGQTYVQLIPGHSSKRIGNGGTLPIGDARSAVELTDLLDIFNHSTAQAIQATIGESAYGFAGRGEALNESLGSLSQLLPPLTELSRALAAQRSNLPGFLRGLEAFAGALAPVSGQFGDLVAGGATTLEALASERIALGQTLDQLPETESATTRALISLHDPLLSLASLTVRLRPAGALLPNSLSQIDSTLGAGIRPLTELVKFSRVLAGSLTALTALSRAKTTPGALRQIAAALSAVGPLLSVLTPAQLHCNVIGLYGNNFSSAWGTLGTGIGPSYVLAGVVTAGATGEALQAAAPSPNLHINYLPHENAHECESGNEPYDASAQDLSNPSGDQSRSVPSTSPPLGVSELARRAGLLNAPPGTPR
jgi:phospholipid/cholesterol/gamma-HCH transport system substrate-binding protein